MIIYNIFHTILYTKIVSNHMLEAGITTTKDKLKNKSFESGFYEYWLQGIHELIYPCAVEITPLLFPVRNSFGTELFCPASSITMKKSSLSVPLKQCK